MKLHWYAVLLSLAGCYLNINKIGSGFYFWIVADMYFVVDHLLKKEYHEAVLFSTYALLALYGAYTWRKNKSYTDPSEVTKNEM